MVGSLYISIRHADWLQDGCSQLYTRWSPSTNSSVFRTAHIRTETLIDTIKQFLQDGCRLIGKSIVIRSRWPPSTYHLNFTDYKVFVSLLFFQCLNEFRQVLKHLENNLVVTRNTPVVYSSVIQSAATLFLSNEQQHALINAKTS